MRRLDSPADRPGGFYTPVASGMFRSWARRPNETVPFPDCCTLITKSRDHPASRRPGTVRRVSRLLLAAVSLAHIITPPLALTPGTRLGLYEVVSAMGAGGMGEVYRATDTKLKRQVAVKILPPSLASDPDRLRRFQREAEVLASLNHPNIAGIYGLEDGGDVSALVMELVEGEDLSQRIARGPIPIDEALPIARQIAEALEVAHEQGIIHRDLKPSNIKVRSDGTAKVLDFGLAKALEPASAQGASAGQALSQSPTITSPAMTGVGMILGTAAYMSPEQARGRLVDRRADVWAFGCVLYEMLTGTQLFKGESGSDTFAAVLQQPIVLTAVPPRTPDAVRAMLARCLERDPRQRLRDIGEARIALDRAIASPTAGDVSVGGAGPAPSRARALLPWSVVGLALIALVSLLAWQWARASVSEPTLTTRVVSDIGVSGSLVVDAGPAAVLSPDGRTIVLRVRQDNTIKLYVRRTNELEPIEIVGSEEATNPFFSHDSSRLGFFAAGGLKTTPLSGGAVTTVADAATGRGAAWAENGDIIFQSSLLFGTPLTRITAAGARTDRGTTLAPGEQTHRWPQILPNGQVLYSGNSDVANWDTGVLRVQTEPGVPGKLVLKGGYHGRYVASGHLLYIHAGTLYGVRFDLDRLEATSQALPIVERVATTTSTGGAQYSIASNGTLAYVPGNPANVDGRMYWLTPDGKTSVLTTTPGAWSNPRFSSDGKLIAMQVTYGSHEQIAIYDWESDRLRQITSDPSNHRNPIWSPDGRSIVYTGDARDTGARNIFRVPADGSGQPEQLTKSPRNQHAGAMHPDGRSIFYAETASATDTGLWVLPLAGLRGEGAPGTPRSFLPASGFHALGALSPDGRLVAYTRSEQGLFPVYVRRVDGEGVASRISTTGAHPVWSKKTSEVLYMDGDQLMAVPIRFDGAIVRAERPRPWAPVRYATAGPTRKYDLHPDGKRAIVATPITAGAKTYDKVVFVFNFFDELRSRLP